MLRDHCWRASSDHPGRNQGERERDQSGGAKDAIGRLAGRYA